MAKRSSSNGCLLPHHSRSCTGSKYSRNRSLTCWNCSNVIVSLHPSMAHNLAERAVEIRSPLPAKIWRMAWRLSRIFETEFNHKTTMRRSSSSSGYGPRSYTALMAHLARPSWPTLIVYRSGRSRYRRKPGRCPASAASRRPGQPKDPIPSSSGNASSSATRTGVCWPMSISGEEGTVDVSGRFATTSA